MPLLIKIHDRHFLRICMSCLCLLIVAYSSSPLSQDFNFNVQAYQDNTSLTTQSLFTVETISEETPLNFKSEVLIDETKDKCSDPQITQPGQPGKIIKTTQITYYDGTEYFRQSLDTQRIEPVTEIQVKGNKKIYKTVNTPDGEVQYWCHLGTFRATAYDSRCPGCNETTAIGMRAGFGVVAVDPKVIPLRSKLYIPGYGYATAGDTGGAIDGKRIDLGFDLIDKSWGVRNVEVYML